MPPRNGVCQEQKNPLLAGLINMLVPGSGYWYVDKDRDRSIKIFIIAIGAIAVIVSNILQNTTGFPLPQGLCMGIHLLMVLVPLFRNGQTAIHHNFVMDSASLYIARQHENTAAQRARN